MVTAMTPAILVVPLICLGLVPMRSRTGMRLFTRLQLFKHANILRSQAIERRDESIPEERIGQTRLRAAAESVFAELVILASRRGLRRKTRRDRRCRCSQGSGKETSSLHEVSPVTGSG